MRKAKTISRSGECRERLAMIMIAMTVCLLSGCDRLGGPFERGQRLLARGDARGAVQAFSEAIERGLEPAKAYAWRCYAHLAAGEHQAAFDDCTAALDRLTEAPGGEAAAPGPYARWSGRGGR